VRIAMLDSMISYLWPEAMPSLTFVGEELDPSDGEVGPDLIFATQDRYITAGALSDDEWAGMCRTLNREGLCPITSVCLKNRFPAAKRGPARLLTKWRGATIGYRGGD
jgi:hypothetical protein